MIIGIIGALPEELVTLTSEKLAKGDYLKLNDQLLVAYSGAGAVNATNAAQLLVEKGVTQLVSWGCAGALSEALKPGDLVFADKLRDVNGSLVDGFYVSSSLHDVIKKCLPKNTSVYTGMLIESRDIVSLSAIKKQLYASTGAIAVDMESVAIAKVAKQHQLSFLALRVIVDPASMDLPQAINQSLNAEGVIEMPKLLSFIAKHPFEILGLFLLGRYFNAAKKTLRALATQLDYVIAYDSDEV